MLAGKNVSVVAYFVRWDVKRLLNESIRPVRQVATPGAKYAISDCILFTECG